MAGMSPCAFQLSVAMKDNGFSLMAAYSNWEYVGWRDRFDIGDAQLAEVEE